MGMDVYGNSPTSEIGRYFRNNIWYWHPMWTYCAAVAPDIIPASNLGHFNDGWGLDNHAALKLAECLSAALLSGHTEQYEQKYQQRLDSLPLEPCTICGATGKRAEPPVVGSGSRPCTYCDGTGKVRSFQARSPFSTDNVREFEAFLRDCGGFKIC